MRRLLSTAVILEAWYPNRQRCEEYVIQTYMSISELKKNGLGFGVCGILG